jgi:hypothetical protein
LSLGNILFGGFSGLQLEIRGKEKGKGKGKSPTSTIVKIT